MSFVLVLAGQRARECAGETGAASEDRARQGTTTAWLWELAERCHPEEVWLAESYLLGERSRDELTRTAPRGPVAPLLLAAARPMIEAASHRARSSQHGPYTPVLNHLAPRVALAV